MTRQQEQLLKAQAALSLAKTLGRRPTDHELQLLLSVLEQAVAGLRSLTHQRTSLPGGAPC